MRPLSTSWAEGKGTNLNCQIPKTQIWHCHVQIIRLSEIGRTALTVTDIHLRCGHGGVNQTLCDVLKRFWIPAAREVVREMVNQCRVCRKRNARPADQIMAPLPIRRLEKTMRPFVLTSVDFGGPFITKQGRGRVRLKRYLCLFGCLSTSAVHLELSYGLDTSSFLNALGRMTSRRGVPREITSDNGTNFVRADAELRELVALLDKSKIQEATAHKGIRWGFQPPAAPHFSGVHEILIKAAKSAIFKILHNAEVTDEELLTAVVQAEGLINSRPLTYVSTEPRDPEPLTPNHFLFGAASTQFAPPNVDEVDYHPRRRWRYVQELTSHFWGRWIKEWILRLGLGRNG